MAITFNMDKVNALKGTPEFIEEALASGKKGVEATCEVAQESGAPVLIKNCEAMQEATAGLWKQGEELQEVLRNAYGIYASVGRPLGFDC